MKDSAQLTADYLGLASDDYDHYGVIGQRVEWIAWDSPAQELEIGDIILEIRAGEQRLEGRSLSRLGYPGGGTSALWSALQAASGASLIIKLWRQGDLLEQAVTPIPQPFYSNTEGQRALFADGPYKSGRTPDRETWSVWYERIIKSWSRILCDGWRQRSFNTRKLLQAHAEERGVVDFLLAQHPGAFAEHIERHWQAVQDKLVGQVWPAESIDLTYRDLAKERRDKIRAVAREEHKAYQTGIAERLSDAFPAPDPYETEAGSVDGRMIVIDRVSPRDMRNDGVQAWYILGDRYRGWYFLDVHSPEVMRMWDGIDAYQRRVTRHLGESYRFYLRLTEDPMIRAKEKRNIALGFKTRLVAVLVGGEMFMRDLDSEQPHTAGSEILQQAAVAPPPDSTPPEELARKRIEAVKLLRQDAWEELFADWTVSSDWSGNPIFLPYGFGPSDKRSGWEQSQKRFFSDVLDARVLEASEPFTVLPADSVHGTPQVEECEVLVEHVGEFEGEYRSFKDSWLTRVWRLQRVDGGPWRFVYPRAL
jgi:hypothetical protein